MFAMPGVRVVSAPMTGAVSGEAGERYRCSGCGNLTRFDVVATTPAVADGLRTGNLENMTLWDRLKNVWREIMGDSEDDDVLLEVE